jgi:hypothetical protein
MEDPDDGTYASQMSTSEDYEDGGPRKRRKRTNTYTTAGQVIPVIMPTRPDLKGLSPEERRSASKIYERDMMLWIMENGTLSERACGPCERTGTLCVRHPIERKCAVCLRRHDVCEYWDENVINHGRRRVGIRSDNVTSESELPRLRKKVVDGNLRAEEWAENFVVQRTKEKREKRLMQWDAEQRWLDILFGTELPCDEDTESEVPSEESSSYNPSWALDCTRGVPPKFKIKIRIRRDPLDPSVVLSISSITLLAAPYPPPYGRRTTRSNSEPSSDSADSPSSHLDLDDRIFQPLLETITSQPVIEPDSNEGVEIPPSTEPIPIDLPSSLAEPLLPAAPHQQPDLNSDLEETAQPSTAQTESEYLSIPCQRCFAFRIPCHKTDNSTPCLACGSGEFNCSGGLILNQWNQDKSHQT